MNFMLYVNFLNVLKQQHLKHYANDAEVLKHHDLFRKSKARVAKLNALNPEPVSGITSMMDFSQVVFD